MFQFSDRATYLHLKPQIDLKMTTLSVGILMNPYSIIQLSTIKDKQSIAIELETHFTSDIVMSKIENFTINGEQSFLCSVIFTSKAYFVFTEALLCNSKRLSGEYSRGLPFFSHFCLVCDK